MGQQTDDHDARVEAALEAAATQVFGAEPGKLPSLLYDVLVRTTDDAQRSRVAAALARCWVYAGESRRAARFSDEAVHHAHLTGDPALLADALDAALASHWGPDDLDQRRVLARELDEIAAHVPDPEARLQAHLWALHVATENLDVQAMHRQMRALERLGEESPRAMFFAASRRLMLELVRGSTENAERLIELAAGAGESAGLPDAWMVVSMLTGYTAITRGDRALAATLAQGAEDFALAEGSSVVLAEAAFPWVAAGEPDHAHDLVRSFGGGVLESLPHDQNWLLTVQLVLEVALAVGDLELIGSAAALLTPYADRAVVNAGAVLFHGTTDDTLSRAFDVLGRPQDAAPLRARALATYERIGAVWWRDRLASDAAAPATPEPAQSSAPLHLHPGSGGLWLVGRDATPVVGLRGFGYLRELVSRPGRPVAVLDLVGASGGSVQESGLGELADKQALAAYRKRLADLDAELGEAEDWADAARAEQARTEKDALLDEISRATGLGGRPRTTGSSAERARVAVKKAITTAIARIENVDEPMARHLRRHVQTGLTCCYEPDPDDELGWVLS